VWASAADFEVTLEFAANPLGTSKSKAALASIFAVALCFRSSWKWGREWRTNFESGQLIYRRRDQLGDDSFASHRGRRQESPVSGASTKETVKPLRGRCRTSGVTAVTTLVCFFLLRTRLRVRLAPGISRALFYWRDNVLEQPGRGV